MKKLPWLGLLVFLLVSCQQEVVVTQSHLPIISIDTSGRSIPDDPKIVAKMKVINNEGVNHFTDTPNAYNGEIGIELRGTSSQFFPKKNYSLETWDTSGEDLDVELLGLPEESDWVLYAPFTDKSLMRNNLAYQLGQDLGYYASRQVFVELFLNQRYQGLYVLMEKVKRDKNRVNISRLEDDITGGYLFEMECSSNPPDAGDAFFMIPNLRYSQVQDCYFIFEYPNADDITTEQHDYIQGYFTEFYTALLKGSDYEAYIDLESFIDHILLNEVFKNTDYMYRSTYFHKDKQGLLQLGPLWDYDIALGNHRDKGRGEEEGFLMTQQLIARDLLRDPDFVKAYIARYRQLRTTELSTLNLHKKIDQMVTEIDKASERNFQRWPILGVYIWPNRFLGNTYQSEVDYLKDWLETRLAWLDVHIEDLIQ